MGLPKQVKPVIHVHISVSNCVFVTLNKPTSSVNVACYIVQDNIKLRITGPLWWESPTDQRISLTAASHYLNQC